MLNQKFFIYKKNIIPQAIVIVIKASLHLALITIQIINHYYLV